MNQINEKKMFSILGFACKSKKIIFGYDKSSDYIQRNIKSYANNGIYTTNSPIVVVSNDASSNTINKINNLKKKYPFTIIRVSVDSADLSHLFGRDSSLSLLLIYDKNFTQYLHSLNLN